MSDALPELHKALREGQQKLIYSLLGGEAAVFAYLGKDFVAAPIGFTRNTFELFGLATLALSIIVGILALSAYLHVQQLIVEHLKMNGDIRDLRTAAESGEKHINFATGTVSLGGELMQQADELMVKYRELDAEILDGAKTTKLLGLTHTIFLFGALLLLIASRSIGLFR